MRLAGIDGCPSGWVAVVADDFDPSTARLCHSADLSSLMDGNGIGFAAIDMPIGLVSGPHSRDVEAGMRAILKGKASSVFPTPCRMALAEMTYFDASFVNAEALGKGLPKQTFMLFPKLREVDEVVRALGQDRLREGHPEVSFAVLNSAPVLSKKRTPEGARERIGLLAAEGIDAHPLLSAASRRICAVDDVLDAAVMLLTALRFQRNQHLTIPAKPSRDSVGLEMSVIA